MIYILGYIILASCIACLIMCIDKQKAIKQKWRISEKTLWTFAIIGGSLGILVGMSLFRHKTKHRSFQIGIPVLIMLQTALLIVILQNMS
ncbi:DUF1294 domain-containing protein [Bacillus salitolerans]|uniref:DUF1294 domain-containing protein n=1 Tax=Bacillus salitolerans TaxID=1437434 RepID=A0ABW4LL79_9BACI